MTTFDMQSHTHNPHHDVVHISPNIVVPSDVLRRGSQTILLIVGLFLIGALLIASLVLGSAMLAIGTFVAFSMMMLIGMPLILACVEDAIDSEMH